MLNIVRMESKQTGVSPMKNRKKLINSNEAKELLKNVERIGWLE